MNYKLGKLPKKHDDRNLKLSSYLSNDLVPPASSDWTANITNWQMFLNDKLGDCTIASAAHLIMGWSANVGMIIIPEESDVIKAYKSVSGYNEQDPSSDRGAIELDVLKYWKNSGIAGQNINAFAEVNPRNLNHVKLAISLFGGLYIGVTLTQKSMDESNDGEIWADTTDNNILGGHAICLVAYDENSLTCVTWGKTQKMTYDWFLKYCDEAYAIVSKDFINNEDKSPDGINFNTLLDDLYKVSN